MGRYTLTDAAMIALGIVMLSVGAAQVATGGFYGLVGVAIGVLQIVVWAVK